MPRQSSRVPKPSAKLLISIQNGSIKETSIVARPTKSVTSGKTPIKKRGSSRKKTTTKNTVATSKKTSTKKGRPSNQSKNPKPNPDAKPVSDQRKSSRARKPSAKFIEGIQAGVVQSPSARKSRKGPVPILTPPGTRKPKKTSTKRGRPKKASKKASKKAAKNSKPLDGPVKLVTPGQRRSTRAQTPSKRLLTSIQNGFTLPTSTPSLMPTQRRGKFSKKKATKTSNKASTKRTRHPFAAVAAKLDKQKVTPRRGRKRKAGNVSTDASEQSGGQQSGRRASNRVRTPSSKFVSSLESQPTKRVRTTPTSTTSSKKKRRGSRKA